MKTVFNTGKVQIGAAYVPPVREEIDPDMQRLQRALVATEAPVDVDGIVIAAVCLVVSVFAVVNYLF